MRRVIRNGQFNAVSSPNWTPDVVTSQATYAPASPHTLTAVANVANVQVGSLVTGNGVGREVYVTSKNDGAGTITLSQPLYDAAGTQTFTFTRFKYILDFSGYSKLSKFTITDVEFQCATFASGVMLAPAGQTFHLKDCFVTKPVVGNVLWAQIKTCERILALEERLTQKVEALEDVQHNMDPIRHMVASEQQRGDGYSGITDAGHVGRRAVGGGHCC